MNHSALLRLVVMIAATVAVGAMTPARATSDLRLTHSAPHWLDQTIYRPDCMLTDCACDCRSDRLCIPACVRW
jgi:hypothetical protein